MYKPYLPSSCYNQHNTNLLLFYREVYVYLAVLKGETVPVNYIAVLGDFFFSLVF